MISALAKLTLISVCLISSVSAEDPKPPKDKDELNNYFAGLDEEDQEEINDLVARMEA